jgi:hypothetical protein
MVKPADNYLVYFSFKHPSKWRVEHMAVGDQNECAIGHFDYETGRLHPSLAVRAFDLDPQLESAVEMAGT